MNKLVIGIAVSFVAVMGFATVALAGETSAAMEKAKGEVKATTEESKARRRG